MFFLAVANIRLILPMLIVTIIIILWMLLLIILLLICWLFAFTLYFTPLSDLLLLIVERWRARSDRNYNNSKDYNDYYTVIVDFVLSWLIILASISILVIYTHLSAFCSLLFIVAQTIGKCFLWIETGKTRFQLQQPNSNNVSQTFMIKRWWHVLYIIHYTLYILHILHQGLHILHFVLKSNTLLQTIYFNK